MQVKRENILLWTDEPLKNEKKNWQCSYHDEKYSPGYSLSQHHRNQFKIMRSSTCLTSLQRATFNMPLHPKSRKRLGARLPATESYWTKLKSQNSIWVIVSINKKIQQSETGRTARLSYRLLNTDDISRSEPVVRDEAKAHVCSRVLF